MPDYTPKMKKLMRELWPEEEERRERERLERERLEREREERERLQRELKDPVKVREELNNRRRDKWTKSFLKDFHSLEPPEIVQWEEALDRKGFLVLRFNHRGNGELSECYTGKWKDVEKQVACKVLRWKEACYTYKIEDEIRQLKLLNNLSHSKLIRVIKIFEVKQTQKINIFMQLADKGSVQDIIRKQKGKPLSEQTAKTWARDMAEALDYLHSMGIGHRRVTPKNLLIDEEDNARLSLPELFFELCDKNGKIQNCNVPGTRGYHWAPEILKGGYDPLEADVWAFGVVVYYMLTTKYPFTKVTRFEQMKTDTENKKWAVSSSEGVSKLTDEQKKFFESIFVMDPIKRVSIEEALSLPWLKL